MRGLTLYTVPSRFMTSEASTRAPYQRVVGVETAAGLTACRFAIAEKPRVTHLEEVPGDMAATVARFFERHIADADPEQAVRSKMRYNCHIFALAIQGEDITSLRELDERLTAVEADAVPFVGHLPAGRHGIVRNEVNEDTSHSFAGLGVDTPLTLQALNHNGNMGLMPYNQVLPEYGRYQGGEYVLAA